jgi:DNA-binding XRE family transcriptional regulator
VCRFTRSVWGGKCKITHSFQDRLAALKSAERLASDEELAAYIGVSRKTLFSARKTKPTRKMLLLLAAAEARSVNLNSARGIQINPQKPNDFPFPRAEMKPSTSVKSNGEDLQRLEKLVRERAPHYGSEKKMQLAAAMKELNEVVNRLNKLMEEQ